MFLIKCFDRQLYFSAKMISLGFCFSHAKTLFYIVDINKSIFQQIIINSMKTVCKVSRVTTKPTIWHVRPAKTPISLGIRSVWSESSLSPWRNIKSLATHWAHSEDSDQTGHPSDPSLRWAHTGILLVLSCCGSCVKKLKTCFITSLGEEGSGLCASRAFVRLFWTG